MQNCPEYWSLRMHITLSRLEPTSWLVDSSSWKQAWAHILRVQARPSSSSMRQGSHAHSALVLESCQWAQIFDELFHSKSVALIEFQKSAWSPMTLSSQGHIAGISQLHWQMKCSKGNKDINHPSITGRSKQTQEGTLCRYKTAESWICSSSQRWCGYQLLARGDACKCTSHQTSHLLAAPCMSATENPNLPAQLTSAFACSDGKLWIYQKQFNFMPPPRLP